jgi:hypothetical protein
MGDAAAHPEVGLAVSMSGAPIRLNLIDTACA